MSRVLVVEDDRYLNKLISDRLLLEGFEVISVLDGESAWLSLEEAQANDRGFDVLLLDMLIPKLLGAQLLSRLKENEGYDELRKICISGIFTDPQEIAEISSLQGVESFWTKPFDIDALVQALRGEAVEPKKAQAKAGDLSDLPIERVFFEAYTQAFTGRLHLVGDQSRRRVYFLNGHPVAADSTALSESFGESLVQLEIIDEQTRERASQKMVEDNSYFGATLVEMGAIDNDGLFKALRRHCHRLLLNVFLSRQGRFEFEPLDSLPGHLPRIEFNPFLLILSSQEKLLSIEALAQLYKIKVQFYPQKVGRFYQVLPLLNLPEKVLETLKGMESNVSLAELLRVIDSSSREPLLRSFYALESIDLLRWYSEPQHDLDDVGLTDFSSSIQKTKEEASDEVDEELFAAYMGLLNQNYFEMFGVSLNAGPEEIESAYQALRNRYHPENFIHISGQSKRVLDDILARLDSAFQCLQNPEAREEYEKTIQRISEDSAADSKRYLRALDFFREGKDLLLKEKFDLAKQSFDRAHSTWTAGIEYLIYSHYAQFRKWQLAGDTVQATQIMQKIRELVMSHAHVETGFVILGHCYKALNHIDAARDAYVRACEINEGNAEAQNALAKIATEDRPKRNWNKQWRLKKKSLFKAIGYLFLGAASVGALFFAMTFEPKDPAVLDVDIGQLQKIAPVQEGRMKALNAKLYIEKEWLQEVPDPVLKSKCIQLLGKLGQYGTINLYLFERDSEGQRLHAICDEKNLQRF